VGAEGGGNAEATKTEAAAGGAAETSRAIVTTAGAERIMSGAGGVVMLAGLGVGFAVFM
jgi:hypothetical protein